MLFPQSLAQGETLRMGQSANVLDLLGEQMTAGFKVETELCGVQWEHEKPGKGEKIVVLSPGSPLKSAST